MSLPAMEWLRGGYTEVWCAEANVPLARFADSAQSIGSVGLDRLGILNDADVWERLAGFDRIHSWYGTNRPEFREAVRGLPFRFYPALPQGDIHATDFYCAQTGAPPSAPRILTPARSREGFVVLHPFASNRAKQWPLERFRALAAILPEIRWCAGPEDLERHPEFWENAVCKPNLFELACWIAGARAYIGNDTGITHLAAAAGTPTVALFGSTDPGVWSPRGPHVRVLARNPMAEIAPPEVASALNSLL